MVNLRFLVERSVGTAPFSFTRTGLATVRVERLRTTTLDDVTDLDAAYALARIAWTELEAFGTSGGQRLDDDEIALLLRSLTGVLRRLKTPLELPFRDFKSFKSFWKQQGMSDSYEARRSYLGRIFEPVLKKLDAYHPHLAPGRVSSHRITEVTRRRLREGLPTAWWGTLDELQFLERLYDLNNLPSLDPKHVTAAEDIGHHCILDPDDWEADWIWRDERFALADGDDELLRFLAEMLHPAVRTDADEVERLRAWMNETLAHDGYELTAVDTISSAPVFTARSVGAGVSGAMKNLFFAADGPKPEFVLGDAINNDVLLVKNGEFCLQYDQALGAAGLTWGDLITWWRTHAPFAEDATDQDVGRALYKRLSASLHRDPKRPEWVSPERKVFRAYCRRYPIDGTGAHYPALIPQVYLHLDPRTRLERGGRDSVLGRERMDFLLLLPRGVRIVVEVDGQQHYSEGDMASPRLYSKMVSEDRSLRLKGYQVYRFGGHELGLSAAPAMLHDFFGQLVEHQR